MPKPSRKPPENAVVTPEAKPATMIASAIDSCRACGSPTYIRVVPGEGGTLDELALSRFCGSIAKLHHISGIGSDAYAVISFPSFLNHSEAIDRFDAVFAHESPIADSSLSANLFPSPSIGTLDQADALVVEPVVAPSVASPLEVAETLLTEEPLLSPVAFEEPELRSETEW